MTNDFLYTTTPLIEVITEVRWQLQPLLAIPNAAIDPHFSVFAREFTERAKAGGFGLVERLVPEQMPTEMFPYAPLIRYRRSLTQWPLLQLGPGVLAVNNVPPYQGWASYRAYLEQAVAWLFATYPMPEKYLTITKLEVRYLDGFTKTLGYSTYLDFMNNSLNFGVKVPDRIAELSEAPQNAVIAVEIQLPSVSPKNSMAVLKSSPGKVRNDDALIMELLCRTEHNADVQKPEAILQWMDSAHNLVRDVFNRLTSDELKERMGPKIELKGDAT